MAVPLSLTVATSRDFPVQRVDDTRVVRAQGSDSALVRQFAGCLLRDVLNAAKLTEGGRNDLRRTIVVATASDGYKAVFSWAELFNSSIGDGVLIVYERDGAPLGDDEGRIALVSLKDTRPGSASRQMAGDGRCRSRSGLIWEATCCFVMRRTRRH